MQRWKGKHPIPWDFFYSFNDLSGQNLNWFWNSWFFSHGYIDLGIHAVRKKGSIYRIEVGNTGGFPNPFDLQITYKDGTTAGKHYTPAVWKENQKTATLTLKTKKRINQLKIDNGIWMDANPEDNHWNAGR